MDEKEKLDQADYMLTEALRYLKEKDIEGIITQIEDLLEILKS